MQACIHSFQTLLGFGGAHKSQELEEAERQIPAAELATLQDSFRRIAGNREALAQPDFLTLVGLTDAAMQPLADGLWSALCPAGRPAAGTAHSVEAAESASAALTLKQLTIAKWRCVHAGDQAGIRFAYVILGPDADGRVSWGSLSAAAAAAVQWATGAAPSDDTVQAIVAGAQAGAAETEAAEEHLTLPAFQSWSKRMPALQHTLRALLSVGDGSARSSTAADSVATNSTPSDTDGGGGVGEGVGSRPTSSGSSSVGIGSTLSVPPRQPRLVPLPGMGLESCMLRPEWAWALVGSGFIGTPRCGEWRLLYNSPKHGQSFSTFMGRCGEKGATLLLVRDKGGHVFGGVAASPWERHGDFYGSFDSFPFSLLPSLAFFRPSGANQNFQFCGQNFSQVPNGIGFGGQIDYFGLFLDGSFDKGTSRESATYKSPSLSSEPVFQVDCVECWQLDVPKAPDPLAPKRRGGSVLDKTAEQRAFMEMAGRKMTHAER